MENEGIMGLPAGQAMQNQAPPQQLPFVSSADSYDAALSALGLTQNGPAQVTEVKKAVQEALRDLDLSASEVASLLDVLEYMSQNPQEYPQLRQRLIESGMMDPDDLPETYDAAYLGMAIMVLNEYRDMRSAGAQAPMQMAPEVENLGPMPMAEGGLADVASYLASQGRNGDTMLAHITPVEARLLKAMGGSGTINPRTGIQEFFLKKLFKGIKKAVKSLLKNPIVRVVATVALATVLGPAGVGVMSSAAAAATASAATTLGAGGNVKDALISAATSYFGAGGKIGSFNPAAAVAEKVAFLPGGATGTLAQSVGAGVTGTGIGLLAGMKPEEALRMGAMQGLTTGATRAFQNWMGGQQAASPAPAEAAPTMAPGAETQTLEQAMASAQQQAAEVPGVVAQPGMTQYGAQPPAPIGTTPSQVAAGAPGATPTAQNLVPGKLFTERLGQLASNPSFETFKNVFFVNPNVAEGLGRYVPAGLTLAGLSALSKPTPVDQAPLFDRTYGGAQFIRDNPQLFGGTLGRMEGIPAPYNPMVPTTSPTLPPGAQIPVYTPRGVTTMPGGVPQPYNIAGLYGIPDLSAPVPQPVYMNRGGDPKTTHFPRKTGPINGPGTGTSDSIPAMLSDGEFVFTARAVRNAGGGSRRKGAKRMYALMKKLEGGAVKG